MITLNGKQFAETETEMVDSLFLTGGTCVGYAKRCPKSIILTDIQKNRIGVINQYGVLCKASKLAEVTGDKNAKGYWYSYGDIDIIGTWDSYMKQQEEIQEALKK